MTANSYYRSFARFLTPKSEPETIKEKSGQLEVDWSLSFYLILVLDLGCCDSFRLVYEKRRLEMRSSDLFWTLSRKWE
jgi:hypothetical protein